MDVMETVQILGNLGEFVAAIAVVVTLIYVAAQVKHGKSALDANTQAMEREYEIQAQEGCGGAIDSTELGEKRGIPQILEA